MTDTEIWKDIPGFEGRYQASNLGRVKSLDRVIEKVRGESVFQVHWKGRILCPACSQSNPHLYVMLGRAAGSKTVHQLVASAFLGPCPVGMEVRHLDGNAQNNRIENLEYGTRTQNILDTYATKTPWRKLTAVQVKEIRDRALAGERTRDLAKAFGISQGHVCRIKARGVYAWL